MGRETASVSDEVARLAELAHGANVHGVVCSGVEAAMLHRRLRERARAPGTGNSHEWRAGPRSTPCGDSGSGCRSWGAIHRGGEGSDGGGGPRSRYGRSTGRPPSVAA
jgi:hypothetical protein